MYVASDETLDEATGNVNVTRLALAVFPRSSRSPCVRSMEKSGPPILSRRRP